MVTNTSIATIETAPIAVKQVLYTGKVHIAGGRDGWAKSEDGRLDIGLSSPGSRGNGTNPEQLFAAGWSACFIGAMRHSAGKLQISLPADTAVDAEVDLATNDTGFLLQARLTISLPGLPVDQAMALIEATH